MPLSMTRLREGYEWRRWFPFTFAGLGACDCAFVQRPSAPAGYRSAPRNEGLPVVLRRAHALANVLITRRFSSNPASRSLQPASLPRFAPIFPGIFDRLTIHGG
jgi:hypothetical protein